MDAGWPPNAGEHTKRPSDLAGAEGDCAAGCRIPEPLRTALEKM